MTDLFDGVTPFELHKLSCDRCKNVDLNKTATLAKTCLTGAPLLRDDLTAEANKKSRKVNKGLKNMFEDEHKTTRKKLQEVMRYVEA